MSHRFSYTVCAAVYPWFACDLLPFLFEKKIITYVSSKVNACGLRPPAVGESRTWAATATATAAAATAATARAATTAVPGCSFRKIVDRGLPEDRKADSKSHCESICITYLSLVHVLNKYTNFSKSEPLTHSLPSIINFYLSADSTNGLYRQACRLATICT